MKRFVRVLKALGKGLLVLLAFVVVVLLITRWVFVRQLSAEISAIRAHGEPLTEAEMAGPPVPDSENAALVYEKAFRELPKGDVFWKTLKPIQKATEKGDPASLRKARLMIQPFVKALTLSRQAASMPACRFPHDRAVRFSDSPGFKIRRLSQLLLHSARLNARSGRMDEALHDLATSLAMNNMLCGQDDTVSALTQESMVWWACTELRKSAGDGHINRRQADRLHAEFLKLDIRAIHKHGLKGERAYLLSIDHSDPVTWSRKRGIPMSDWDAFKARTNPVGLAWRNVVLVGDQAAMLCYFRKLITADYDSYADARSLQYEAEWGIPFYAILTKILAPVDARSLDSMFRAQAEVKGSQVFLALLAYRDRHGAYPASLAELRKDPGWAVPKDPFNGREFIYGRKGKGFVLYSVGPDMKDNGGKPQATGKAYRAGAEYDIVWEMRR